MAYEVNEKIRELVPYQPITGNYRIRLDANESFLVPENEILKAIQKDAVSVAFQRYPDPIAQELCEAFAKAYNVNVENVVAGNGSDELISLLFSSFLMKGECAVTLSPDFSMYSFYCGIAEGQNKEFKKRDDFSFSIDDLIDFVNKNKARMLIFSNPCNPTSLGVKREEIRKLVSSVNALVVLDEAYMDFWDQSMLSEVNQYDNLIILRTCSKAIGAASLRLGFAVSNVNLIRFLKAVKSPYNVNSISQKIGAEILKRKDWLAFCRQKICKSRDKLFSGLKKIEEKNLGRMRVLKPVTNFVTVKTPECTSIYQKLLKDGIAIRCFDGFLRITAGSETENEELLSAFEKALKE
jgi:histidinol-phosphate aminotransferase